MIQLKNVSDIDIIKYLSKGSYDLNDMEQIKRVINSRYSTHGDIFSKIVDDAERRIEKANKLGKEPHIYDVNLYDNTYDSKECCLYMNDKNTLAINLIRNPVDRRNVKQRISNPLLGLSIGQVKQLLTHCDPEGNNLMEKYLRCGPVTINKLIEKINMYDKQMLRLYAAATKDELMKDELFYYRIKERKNVVNLYINYIVEYLLDTAKEEFVWGKLSDTHKLALERSTRNDNQVRRNLVSIIASYTTVDEIIYFTTGLVINKVIQKGCDEDYLLENINLANKRKILNRFIKR